MDGNHLAPLAHTVVVGYSICVYTEYIYIYIHVCINVVWYEYSPLMPTGSIEVTIATMRKAVCAQTKEVYVVGFVLSYLLPNKLAALILPSSSDIRDRRPLHQW